MNKKYILFLSSKCKFSKKIHETLKQNIIYPYVEIIDISHIESIPKRIERVPTLVVSKDEIIIGNNILEWANKMNTTDESDLINLSKNPISLSPLSSMNYTFVSNDVENTSENSFQTKKYSLIDSPNEADVMYDNQQNNSRKCTEKDYEDYIKKRNML